MKRAKYENVLGLDRSLLKHATCFFHRAKCVDLQIWKDKTFKLVGFLVGCKKKRYHCMILEANCAGKLERLRLCGELCGIIDETIFLKSQEAKSALTIG